MSGHNWSGWPGAICLTCGIEDQNELAIVIPCEHLGPVNMTDEAMGLCLLNHNPPCSVEED